MRNRKGCRRQQQENSTAKTDDIVDFSQNRLMEKLNLYLKMQDRKNDDDTLYQIKSEGYCHGLTLLWLEKMIENKVSWFYETNKNIIQYDNDKLRDIELDIEKFLAMIEWAQRSRYYTEDNICYNNIDLILEAEKQISFDKFYTLYQLKKLLTYQQGKNHMICITSCEGDSKEHSVGVFTDGNQYYFYDANYKSGQATCFQSSSALANEIFKRLYTNFGEEIPKKAQLEIKVIIPSKKINNGKFKQDSYLSALSSFWKPAVKKHESKNKKACSNSSKHLLTH